MAVHSIHFRHEGGGKPDFQALKFRLGSMRGIAEMNIDSRTQEVALLYEDSRVSQQQLAGCMAEFDYQPRF